MKMSAKHIMNNIFIVYRELFRYSKPARWQFPVYAMLRIISPLVVSAIPALAVALLTGGNLTGFVEGISVLLFIYMVISGLCIVLENRCNLNMTGTRLHTFVPRLLRKCLTMDFCNLESADKQKKMFRGMQTVNNQSRGVQGMACYSFQLFYGLFGLVSYGSIMFTIHWSILLIVAATTVITFLLKSHAIDYWHKLSGERYEAGRINAMLEQQGISLEYGKDIRIYHVENWFRTIFDEQLRILRRAIAKQELHWYFPTVGEQIGNFVRDFVMYFILIRMVLDGMISVAQFTFYVGIVEGFSAWMNETVTHMSQVMESNVEMGYYSEAIDTPDVFLHGKGEKPDLSSAVSIEFRDVSFCYEEGGKEILSHLSFRIEPGQKIALVGNNGAGKTTIVKLLCGFYMPTEGEVLVNGISTRDYDMDEYGKLISPVFQDGFMSAFTVATNVAGGREADIDRKRVRQCLKEAGIWDKINSLNQKEDMGSSILIDALLQKRAFEEIFTFALGILGLNFVLNILCWGIDKLVNIRKYMLADQIQKMISEKGLTLDYEILEKKETLECIEKAREGINCNGDITSFCDRIASMLGVVADIIYAAVLFFPVFLAVGSGTVSAFYRFVESYYGSIALNLILVGQLVFLGWSQRRMGQLQKQAFDINVDSNRFYGYFMSFLSNTDNYGKGKDIRMYGIGDTVIERYKHNSERMLDIFVNVEKRIEKYSIINKCCSTIYTIASYVYVGVKAGLGLVSIGSVARYVGAFTKFSSALGSLVGTYMGVSICAQYLAYFEDFMEIKNQKYEGKLPVEKRNDNEYEFEFRDVSFSYPNSQEPVLDHVTLKVKIGRKLSLVGPNGAGKTTFIKLLCRLYDPTEGQILLNGVDIRYYDYDEYLQLFSVVFQDFKLFSFSIAENVAVSKEFDENKVTDCLEKAGFTDPEGRIKKDIHTNLYKMSEDGIEISGGEAQKIAIARALYKDSPLVILDEPTSALDPISEYEIYRRFDELVENKTAIYISHRMSSCRFCNQIIVFDGGRIVQQGSHDELLKDEGGALL